VRPLLAITRRAFMLLLLDLAKIIRTRYITRGA